AHQRATPALDCRRRARPVRSPARLPVLATLPLCDRPLPCRSPAAAHGCGRGALPLSAHSRHPAKSSRQGGGLMGETVLKATDLARHYDVSRGVFREKAVLKALDGASFTVERGKTLAVVGESGCGKSTLARIVTMIEPPTSGTLEIAGQNI